jgi:hypothetical protein
VRYRLLDPEASTSVIGHKLRQTGQTISTRSVERVRGEFGLQKELYASRPAPLLSEVETQRSMLCRRVLPADSESLERGVRQLLADKIGGTLVGLWLQVPEHFRLGTWDLLCAWTGQPGPSVAPRLALQPLHEAAPGTGMLAPRLSPTLARGGVFP